MWLCHCVVFFFKRPRAFLFINHRHHNLAANSAARSSGGSTHEGGKSYDMIHVEHKDEPLGLHFAYKDLN
jgi:hypothetical protein